MKKKDEIEVIEIIRVFWKRKTLFLILPLILGILAFSISNLIESKYKSSITLDLGNISDELYTNQDSVKEIIVSQYTLDPIMKKFGLSENLEQFREKISVKTVPNTKMITIDVLYKEPEMAKKIVDEIANVLVSESSKSYTQRKKIFEQLLNSYQKNYEVTEQSLSRNKLLITGIEANKNLSNEEKELIRIRILDYIIKDENMLNTLSGSIKELQLKLLDMNQIKIIKPSNLPTNPASSHIWIITLLALAIGIFIAFFLVIVLEYLSKNPIHLSSVNQKNNKLTD